MLDESGRQFCDKARRVRQMRSNLVERTGPVHFRRRLPPWVELVKVPAQACDDSSPFGNEVFAMVDQEPELTFCAVEAGFGQIGLTQGRACDCERVDRIRLAVGAGAVADVRHQFRRDANYSFAGGDQIAFEAPAQVTAVSMAHSRSPDCSVAQRSSDRWSLLFVPMVFVDSCRPV